MFFSGESTRTDSGWAMPLFGAKAFFSYGFPLRLRIVPRGTLTRALER